MNEETTWPQWLRDADTLDAVVEITKTGRVIWHDGIWYGGSWHGGSWHDGASCATRACHPVAGHSDGRISIGCQIRTRGEWEAILAGAPCYWAPARDSEQWRLLVAAYRAQCAYMDELGWGGDDRS